MLWCQQVTPFPKCKKPQGGFMGPAQPGREGLAAGSRERSLGLRFRGPVRLLGLWSGSGLCLLSLLV